MRKTDERCEKFVWINRIKDFQTSPFIQPAEIIFPSFLLFPLRVNVGKY